MPDQREPDLRTIVTPVDLHTPRLELRADYFPLPIDLELLQTHYQQSQILSADPLVLKITGAAHVVVLRFGAVVFWQCNDTIFSKILEEIRQLPGMPPHNSEVRDDIVILVDQPE